MSSDAPIRSGTPAEPLPGRRAKRRGAHVKGECVGLPRQLDDDLVVGTLMGVILLQLYAQPPRLHSDRRIILGIESPRPAQNLGGDLVFLEATPG